MPGGEVSPPVLRGFSHPNEITRAGGLSHGKELSPCATTGVSLHTYTRIAPCLGSARRVRLWEDSCLLTRPSMCFPGGSGSQSPARGRQGHKSALHSITTETSAPGAGVLGTSSILGDMGNQRVYYTDMHKQPDEVSMSSFRVGREGRVAARCLGGAIFPGDHLHLRFILMTRRED